MQNRCVPIFHLYLEISQWQHPCPHRTTQPVLPLQPLWCWGLLHWHWREGEGASTERRLVPIAGEKKKKKKKKIKFAYTASSWLRPASSLGSIQKVVCPSLQCGDIEFPDASSMLVVAGRWMASYKACPRATTNTIAVTASLVACCVCLLDLNIAWIVLYYHCF